VWTWRTRLPPARGPSHGPNDLALETKAGVASRAGPRWLRLRLCHRKKARHIRPIRPTAHRPGPLFSRRLAAMAGRPGGFVKLHNPGWAKAPRCRPAHRHFSNSCGPRDVPRPRFWVPRFQTEVPHARRGAVCASDRAGIGLERKNSSPPPAARTSAQHRPASFSTSLLKIAGLRGPPYVLWPGSLLRRHLCRRPNPCVFYPRDVPRGMVFPSSNNRRGKRSAHSREFCARARTYTFNPPRFFFSVDAPALARTRFARYPENSKDNCRCLPPGLCRNELFPRVMATRTVKTPAASRRHPAHGPAPARRATSTCRTVFFPAALPLTIPPSVFGVEFYYRGRELPWGRDRCGGQVFFCNDPAFGRFHPTACTRSSRRPEAQLFPVRQILRARNALCC